MKQLAVLSLALLFTASAFAKPHHHHRKHHARHAAAAKGHAHEGMPNQAGAQPHEGQH